MIITIIVIVVIINIVTIIMTSTEFSHCKGNSQENTFDAFVLLDL